MSRMSRMDLRPSSGSVFTALLVSVSAASLAWGQALSGLNERIASAREQRNEAEIERLVTECETRLDRGESKPELLEALFHLMNATGTWEWDDFQKQQQIPKRIAFFVLEKHMGEATMQVEFFFAMTVSDPPRPRDPNLASLLAERKHRLRLVIPVLHRLLRKIDPSIDLREITLARVQPPVSTRPATLPVIGAEEIEDPALRADFERRFHERELKEQRKGEQIELLLKKKMLLRQLESYIVAVYTLGPPDMPELQQVLETLQANGKTEELEAMAARIMNRVQAAATRPR